MFSRTERLYLGVLSEGSEGSARLRLEAEFPNPTYRRKIMWGIRQKAAHSLADWHLYSTAARRDARILPRDTSGSSDPRPLFADPLVTLLEDFRRGWRRHRNTADGASDTEVPRTR